MLLAQDGHQAGDRIHEGLSNGLIQGAIISTGFRDASKLPDILADLTKVSSDALLIFDNEFYVNAIQGADKFGMLETYPYYCHPLTKKDLVSPQKVQSLIKTALDFQISAGLKNITTPTVIIDSFNSNSETTSLSLCFGSIEYIESIKFEGDIYCSLVISEQALSNTTLLPEFLTTITALSGVKGFYIVFDKTSSVSPYWSNPATLAASMYLTNVLRQNNFDVVIGYSDGAGILQLAAGASSISTGWWENTTNFSQDKYVRREGGRRRKKYFSQNLMNTIYVDTTIARAQAVGLLDKLMPTTNYDKDFAKAPTENVWQDKTAIWHKWAAIQNIIASCSEGGEVKLDKVEASIDITLGLYALLASKGVPFDSGADSARVKTMKQAIALYKEGVV